jgi:hypothetical protein
MDPVAMIDAWRERGDHRFDPVRFRFIEALARRAAAHDGGARRILDDKLVQRVAAYREALEAPRAATARQEDPPRRGALAELVDHIARHASDPEGGAAPSHAASGLAPLHELKTLRYFRGTWSRLSADRRLTQSLAKVPENAGPLNSHHLVHQSLTLMRDLSPEYLNRFMSYVDTLLWVDQANAGSASATASPPRAENHRKAARGKSG